jgi:hypothetical protein
MDRHSEFLRDTAISALVIIVLITMIKFAWACFKEAVIAICRAIPVVCSWIYALYCYWQDRRRMAHD